MIKERLNQLRNLSGTEKICLAAVLLGAAARFYRLGEPLWLDEVLTLNTALKPFLEIPGDLVRGVSGATPPLFYFLLHFWMRLFGASDFSVHFMAACAGLSGIAAVWWAGKSLHGRTAGFAAAAVLAFHPFHLAASQEVRPYGLLVALSVISSCLLWKALKDGGGGEWALYAAASAANLYTHNYAVFLLFAQIVWVAAAFLAGRSRYSWKAGVSFTVILLVYAPWVPCLLEQSRKNIFSFLPYPGIHDIKLTLLALSGFWVTAGAAQAQWLPELTGPALTAYLLLAACAEYYSRPGERGLAAYTHFLPALTLLVPFLLSFNKPIYHAGRYTIIALPFVCLWWGAAAGSSTSARWRAALLSCCLVPSVFTSYGYFTVPKSYDRDIAAYLADRYRPGYVIAMFPEFRKIPIARYYGGAAGAAASVPGKDARELPGGVLVVETWGVGPAETDAAVLEKDYVLGEQRNFGDFAVAKLFLKRAR